jgi:hypothetical protein
VGARVANLRSHTCGAVSVQKRSNLRRRYWYFLECLLGGIGAGKMNRTPDLRITNALLYQLSYTGFFDYDLFTLVKRKIKV